MSSSETFTVALISDVFFGDGARERLIGRLREARSRGAEIAVLPELPLNAWSPWSKEARPEDAEPPEGPRHRMMSDAAREVGIGLVGGAIVIDARDGKRRNTALVFDRGGRLAGAYSKCHLPEEPGFWETSHYAPGTFVSPVFDGFGMRFGVQICSDINRPQGCHLLGAMGAEAILAPRATELKTYARWKPVFMANALTSAAYVLSVNRPGPEQGVLMGGPSIAVSPNHEVLLETTEAVSVVTLRRDVVKKARTDYPGYLPVRAEMYAEAWSRIASGATASNTGGRL